MSVRDGVEATSSISLAYSVDADDAFMFHALRAGAIDTHGLTFTHRRDHTAALNRLAIDAGADVVAVSVGVYPAIAARYQMLSHGASVGRGFGPVARHDRSRPRTWPACASASPAPRPRRGWCCA